MIAQRRIGTGAAGRQARRGAFLAALVLAGCGAHERTDVEVVKAWSDAVRKGDYKQADALFALPSVIENGARVRATQRAEVTVFNRSLPCGAVLERTEKASGGRLLATFRLVPGPGGPCEGTAQVTFRVEKGHITEWRRESDPGEAPPGSVET